MHNKRIEARAILYFKNLNYRFGIECICGQAIDGCRWDRNEKPALEESTGLSDIFPNLGSQTLVLHLSIAKSDLLNFFNDDSGCHSFLIQECWPVGYDLAGLRTPPGKTSDAGWAS